MKISLTSTSVITDINGVAVRLWDGVTEDGVACKVFVHRIAVHESQDASRFEQELQEKLPPPRVVPLGTVL